VAIITVKIVSKDLHLLADRQAMRWRGKSGDIRCCKKAQRLASLALPLPES